mgnify:CR=1 FL=1
MLSLINTIDGTLRTFFNQLTEALGFGGYLGLVLGVELLFILLFVVKTMFSYEARIKRSLDKCNKWLFTNKKIDINNIKEFNALIKKGPKRLVYYWQQFILFRDGGPANYLTEENLIDKPLKTSTWVSNIRNLGILTGVWAVISFVFGLASQAGQPVGFQYFAISLVLPVVVILIGAIAIMLLKGKRALNLDDIYHIYHIFARFITNACVDLTEYIDFNLLFTNKEIENGNAQIREYYEARARQAQKEFEEAQKNEAQTVDYKFEKVGVDGSLLLNRAMKESEVYINKKTATLAKIAQLEGQKDALRRNYETVQMDLQRKLQASKENIQKLIEQQAATTSRMEIGLLRQQQDKESKKKDQLQQDYDQEEQRYLASKQELEADIKELEGVLEESLVEVQKGMSAEYQTFFEKVMRSAYKVAAQQVVTEKQELIDQRDKNEQELINVQTQIKRLMDENETLRDRIAKTDPNYKEEVNKNNTNGGHYDENGNYVYSDGSYHDAEGLFHDADGKVYNMNGELVSVEHSAEEQAQKDREEAIKNQEEQFGSFIDQNAAEEPVEDTLNKTNEEVAAAETTPAEQPKEEKKLEVEDEFASAFKQMLTEGENPEEAKEAEVQPETQDTAATTDTAEQPKEEAAPSAEESATQSEAEATTEAPKRKRGRPAKVKTEVEEPKEEEHKKRGRPRKVVTEEEEKPVEEPKKRGRPRKEPASEVKETPAVAEAPKKRGRPAKVKTEDEEPKVEEPKKRGRPRKEVTEEVKPAEEPKKRGRPRKDGSHLPSNDSFLNKINELISQEENKLKNMKAYFNSEINQALEPQEQDNIEKEKDDIMKAVESLKEQADKAKSNGQSEELSKINKRIEDLINDLTSINSSDESDESAN